jgi:hypothetical protein
MTKKEASSGLGLTMSYSLQKLWPSTPLESVFQPLAMFQFLHSLTCNQIPWGTRESLYPVLADNAPKILTQVTHGCEGVLWLNHDTDSNVCPVSNGLILEHQSVQWPSL